MRAFAFLFVFIAAAIDFVAPGAFAEEKIRLAQSSTATNCMMACNARAALCQTSCVVPSLPPAGAAATNITTSTNATGNTSCILNCSTTQLTCQTSCSLQSPSQ